MNREDYERDYWQKAALDPQVDQKYISDISTKLCLDALENTLAEVLSGEQPLVAELGVGVGRLIVPLARKYPNAKFAGLDISQGMLDLAKTNDPKQLVQSWALLNGREVPLLFNDTKYDVIYSVLVFQHIDKAGIADYFQAIFAALKPGGLFRFQFIEGDEHEPFSHHYGREYILGLIADSGGELVDYEIGLIHPQWTWVTAKAGGNG